MTKWSLVAKLTFCVCVLGGGGGGDDVYLHNIGYTLLCVMECLCSAGLLELI